MIVSRDKNSANPETRKIDRVDDSIVSK